MLTTVGRVPFIYSRRGPRGVENEKELGIQKPIGNLLLTDRSAVIKAQCQHKLIVFKE